MLHYAEQVQAVDTTGVPATAHVLARDWTRNGPTSRARSLTPQEATANAPDADREAGLFRVPRVIGG